MFDVAGEGLFVDLEGGGGGVVGDGGGDGDGAAGDAFAELGFELGLEGLEGVGEAEDDLEVLVVEGADLEEVLHAAEMSGGLAVAGHAANQGTS